MDDKDFKAFRIYIKVANALERNPIVVYYLKTYAINKALEYLKLERTKGNDVSTLVTEVRQWLQGLEELKDTLTMELADKERCKKIFKDFTINLYEESEVDYRNGNLGRGLAKNFLYVSVLFDAWELFGGQDDDIRAKKTYANEARFKIMDAIQKELNSRPRSNNDENGVPKKDTLNLLAKLDFDLVESIYVPQSQLDRFLNSPPHERLCPPNMWETFTLRPVQNGITTNNTAPQWNIPRGTSIRLDSTDMQDEEKPKRTGYIPGIPVGTSVRLDDQGVENMNTEEEEKPKKVGFKGIPMGTSVRLESNNTQEEERPKRVGFIPGIPVGTSVRIENEPVEELKVEEDEKPSRKSSNATGMRIETNNTQIEEKPKRVGFFPGIPVGTSIRLDEADEDIKMEEEQKGKEEKPITPTFSNSPRENTLRLDIGTTNNREEKQKRTGFIPGIPVGTSVRIEDTPTEDNKIEEEKPKKVGIYGIPIGTSVRLDGPVEENTAPTEPETKPSQQQLADLLKRIPVGTSVRLDTIAESSNIGNSTMECEVVPKLDQSIPSFLQIPRSQYLTPTVSQLNSKLNYVSNQVSSRASEPPRHKDYSLFENMPIDVSTEYRVNSKPENSPDQQQRLMNQRHLNEFNEELKNDFDVRIKRSLSEPPVASEEQDKERVRVGCQEVQGYCLKAVSELGVRNIRDAKESILKALRLLEQLE